MAHSTTERQRQRDMDEVDKKRKQAIHSKQSTKNNIAPTIHEYWPKYRSRMLFTLVSMQIIGVLVVALALLITDIADPNELGFWIILVAMLLTMIGINSLLFGIITEPLKQLTAALAKTEGETSPLLPPNPNTPRYQKSGLRPLLLKIYELSVSSNEAADTSASAASSPDTAIMAALDEANAGIVMFDAAHKIIYKNAAAPIKEDSESDSRLQLEFYTDQSLDAWIKECEVSAVHAQKTWSRIASKPTGEDDRHIYDIVATYEKGSTIPVVVVLMEKTKEYAPEDEDLNFIAFAAHELRGPITVIRGYLDTLGDELDSTLSGEQKELLQRLVVSANRLSGYINNILNSSRYDRRHLSVHLVETTLSNIYGMIADDMQLRASSQARILSVDIPTNLPTIAADPTSTSEVLGNLIDNAIKYSNEGGTIQVSAEPQGNFVEVIVVDHGIGMPPNVVSNLFHKFYRSHRSRETVAGTGIGLYISKAIVESHGGTMEVRSVEGSGSTFSFTLPTYASVADKLAAAGGNNHPLIKTHGSAGWIKNHGEIRG